jgi:hypothetical protein
VANESQIFNHRPGERDAAGAPLLEGGELGVSGDQDRTGRIGGFCARRLSTRRSISVETIKGRNRAGSSAMKK